MYLRYKAAVAKKKRTDELQHFLRILSRNKPAPCVDDLVGGIYRGKRTGCVFVMMLCSSAALLKSESAHLSARVVLPSDGRRDLMNCIMGSSFGQESVLLIYT